MSPRPVAISTRPEDESSESPRPAGSSPTLELAQVPSCVPPRALQGAVTASDVPASCTRPLAVVTSLFFMWGFLTCLNDILVPHLKSIFDLGYAEVMLVQFAFFSAYFLFSVPWSRVVNAVGYQRTMVIGLVLMALGALLFVPAASLVSFPVFLGALIVLATGITGLQVSANPYVVVLGKPETASSRLDLTQAFNSLGTTVAPKLGGLFILAAAPLAADELAKLAPAALHAYRVEQAASVKIPYLVISIALVVLAVIIARSKLPRIETAAQTSTKAVGDSLWKHRNLLLGALGIFTYVGAEVSVGSFLVNYLGQSEIGGFSPKTAAGYVSFFWGGAMVGRFLGAPLLRRFRAGHLLAICAVLAAALVGISMLTEGQVAVWSILAVGLFNSIMFPTIFSLGVAELGPLTSSGSGILNMAVVGGALLPLLQGAIADRIGIHSAFFVPVLCYLYILYFALNGSKPNSQRLRAA
jgi:FHS family L-fucose permease-like MFS transporter